MDRNFYELHFLKYLYMFGQILFVLEVFLPNSFLEETKKDESKSSADEAEWSEATVWPRKKSAPAFFKLLASS